MGSFGQTSLKQKISCKCTFNGRQDYVLVYSHACIVKLEYTHYTHDYFLRVKLGFYFNRKEGKNLFYGATVGHFACYQAGLDYI